MLPPPKRMLLLARKIERRVRHRTTRRTREVPTTMSSHGGNSNRGGSRSSIGSQVGGIHQRPSSLDKGCKKWMTFKNDWESCNWKIQHHHRGLLVADDGRYPPKWYPSRMLYKGLRMRVVIMILRKQGIHGRAGGCTTITTSQKQGEGKEFSNVDHPSYPITPPARSVHRCRRNYRPCRRVVTMIRVPPQAVMIPRRIPIAVAATRRTRSSHDDRDTPKLNNKLLEGDNIVPQRPGDCPTRPNSWCTVPRLQPPTKEIAKWSPLGSSDVSKFATPTFARATRSPPTL
mmetsp:Transcript_32317/g.67958  ORF Transcript_32317/g.67958 Transcript_32317/m.67958 type:complete len:287 (+) Transcript_32317:375-1235(+)